jgi:hypothetical protein
LYCYITFLRLDCLMILNIEIPFSLNKTRIGNRIRIRIRAYELRIRIQETKKQGSGSIYSFSTDILYHFLSDWGFRENISRKTFAKKWWNFAKTVPPFIKAFVFAKGQKSVFVLPYPQPTNLLSIWNVIPAGKCDTCRKILYSNPTKNVIPAEKCDTYKKML